MNDQWKDMLEEAGHLINTQIASKLLLVVNSRDNSLKLVQTDSLAQLGETFMDPTNCPLCVITNTSLVLLNDQGLSETLANNWLAYYTEICLPPLSTNILDLIVNVGSKEPE